MSSLPLPDSLWAATANPNPPSQPLNGDIKADVAIVGAGFTGLRAALELSQRGVNAAGLDKKCSWPGCYSGIRSYVQRLAAGRC